MTTRSANRFWTCESRGPNQRRRRPGSMPLIVSACSRTRSRNDRSARLSRSSGQTIIKGMRTVSGSMGRKTTPLPQIAHTRWNQGYALAGLDQRQDGLHHVGLVDYAWREAGAAAEADDRIEELRCPGTMEEDEGFGGQLLHGHHGAGGSRMPFREDGEQ